MPFCLLIFYGAVPRIEVTAVIVLTFLEEAIVLVPTVLVPDVTHTGEPTKVKLKVFEVKYSIYPEGYFPL